MRALFDPKSGAGYTAMKTPIAGTDFQSAGPWYTYDDTPGDVELKNFSVERDFWTERCWHLHSSRPQVRQFRVAIANGLPAGLDAV